MDLDGMKRDCKTAARSVGAQHTYLYFVFAIARARRKQWTAVECAINLSFILIIEIVQTGWILDIHFVDDGRRNSQR